MSAPPEGRPTLTGLLALNRTLAVVLISVLFFGLGENLWRPFLSLYIKDAGAAAKSTASAAAADQPVSLDALFYIGLCGFAINLFEAFCYIGGGHVTARLGDRGSLLSFGSLGVLGYALFLVSPHPAVAIAAALLILGWEPLSVPVTFTTVGSTVSDSKRGMAFAVQSIQKRLPKILGPLIAGFVIDRLDPVNGMRVLVAIALGLALVTLGLQLRFMPHRDPDPPGPPATRIIRDMDPALKRLLLAEVFTRWCDWLVRDFVLIYLVVAHHVRASEAGVLMALQNLVALLTYLPIGQLTKTVGLRPFVGLTFVFFALFPLALVLAGGWWGLVIAFVVYGLREIGEPARKALITTLLPPEVRARGVGLYWGLRSFAICTASLAGAGLWAAVGPEALLFTAFALGAVGAGVYYLLARPADRQ